MKDYVETSEDNGGVHTNSGIPNHAYALTCDGIQTADIGGDWATTIGIALKKLMYWRSARSSRGDGRSAR